MILGLSEIVTCIHYYGSTIVLFCKDDSALLFQTPIEIDLVELALNDCELEYVADFIIKKYHIYNASVHELIPVIKQYLQKSYSNRKVFKLYSTSCIDHNAVITGKKGRVFPARIQVEITGNCNLKCKHCYKKATIGSLDFIKENDICKLLNFIDEDIYELAITGGEPLMHPEFQKITESFRNKCHRLELNTNGTLLDNIDDDTLNLFDLVSISLYGLNDLDYYTNVGIRNGFERLKKGCLKLKKINKDFTISILLSRKVISELPAYVETAISLGASTLKIGVVNKIGRAKEYEECLDTLSSDEIKVAYRKIRLLSKTYADKISIVEWNREVYRNFGKESRSTSFFEAPFRCTAGSLQWAVNENLEFRPCVLMPEGEALMMNFEQWKEIIACKRTANWSAYLSNLCNYCATHGTIPAEYCEQLMLSNNKEGDKTIGNI